MKWVRWKFCIFESRVTRYPFFLSNYYNQHLPLEGVTKAPSSWGEGWDEGTYNTRH